MSGGVTPRDYDREYVRNLPGALQVRVGRDTDRGDISRFVVQLEYYLEDTWQPVVRYDHDPDTEHGHDVTVEGLHIDIYRNNKNYRTEYVAPPMPANTALDFAEDHLSKNLKRFVQRYEQWHEIRRNQ